ncbi:uncharacterized protein PHACADRAFT_246002 [Phanerochaete carnosa HHB-10118-sp]|uniref:Uncharacterized protein n=1 Tax=Phanerochaete carnosa (strain HHB-10118-sp) TaxID=650164 RepID=K5WLU9_PHACS|nr:uncharacterized protein PHACADRAFT_246002 [Phanerochaete carnosa HHB-10118-sp]EKM60164.1 hypothetical protein PHACADRAFT_246002 [Phanerochaete carnosa HHB-10118-sp]
MTYSMPRPVLAHSVSHFSHNPCAGRPAMPEAIAHDRGRSLVRERSDVAAIADSDATPREHLREIREQLARSRRSIENLRQIVERRREARVAAKTTPSNHDMAVTATAAVATKPEAGDDDRSDGFAGDVEVQIQEALDSDADSGESSFAGAYMRDGMNEFWGPGRFRVEIKSLWEHTTLWDLEAEHIYPCVCTLVIADLHTSRPIYDTPPIKNIRLDFWASWNNEPRGQSTTFSDAELEHAAWKASYTGYIVSREDANASMLHNSDSIFMCDDWHSVADGDAYSAHGTLFFVPIPTEQLLAWESRVFRMRAYVVFGVEEPGLSLPQFEACSAIMDVPIESLRKEHHMDGKPLLHRTNLLPGKWD